jgi:endoglucanase
VRDVADVVLALALGGIALGFVLGCGGGDGSNGSSLPTPKETADDASRRFLDRYVAGDGRVRRIDQGDDTVGEGQAYGMLVAAAIGDERRFDLIWRWTKDNLRRPDGLISFLWRKGRIVDPQAASDADVDAARALLVASCRFKRPGYRQEALALGRAILAEETADLQGVPVLTAGPWANQDPITLNPSYFAPATFAALGAASGDDRWDGLSTTSRAVTDFLTRRRTPLPPDWARIEGGRPVPIGAPDNPEGPPRFSFDAFRTLPRLAEDPDPAGRRIAARAWRVFKRADPDGKVPVERALSGRPVGSTVHPVVLVAAAGAAHAAGKPEERNLFLDAAEDLDRRTQTYYGAAWVALGRIFLTTKALDACP